MGVAADSKEMDLFLKYAFFIFYINKYYVITRGPVCEIAQDSDPAHCGTQRHPSVHLLVTGLGRYGVRTTRFLLYR